MNISKFDGKTVRITDKWGDVFEGIAQYNSIDYCEHEFGVSEDSLQILNTIFYNKTIKSVESLEDHTGPYGKFTTPYGKVEEMMVEDGDIIDLFEYEEDEHTIRMLRLLNVYLDPSLHPEYKYREEAISALSTIIKYTKNDEIKKEAMRLVDKNS